MHHHCVRSSVDTTGQIDEDYFSAPLFDSRRVLANSDLRLRLLTLLYDFPLAFSI